MSEAGSEAAPTLPAVAPPGPVDAAPQPPPGPPIEAAPAADALRHPAAPEIVATLADSPAVVSDARAMAAGALLAWACPEPVIEDAVVVISELVTNAVLHAAPPVRLRLALASPPEGRTVRIEVTDGSVLPPEVRSPSTSAPGGRGLRIVAALTARHGVLLSTDGKTVWAELLVTG
ncbi:MAG: hypothetical protein AVDCRST_MAG41-964 [uncultured Corynebacteriales bacterium]|uniref:Histidine kinase/HSP90-like ATPase domain-containing protein n=1 Tax=uncultured Mycobacteriales bacterium TaxID=581187 RepID=A0A6J4HKQ1_9ACTN|nr:MAG: hypothetical protein AVDCRST_MAG41-964 [uncultured Corynebacteriales bacterium]